MKVINILVIIFLQNRKQNWLNLVDRQSFSSGVRVRVSASGQRRLCCCRSFTTPNPELLNIGAGVYRRNFTMWNGYIAEICRYLTCGSDTSWFSCQIWKFSVLRLSDVPRGIVRAFVYGRFTGRYDVDLRSTLDKQCRFMFKSKWKKSSQTIQQQFFLLILWCTWCFTKKYLKIWQIWQRYGQKWGRVASRVRRWMRK